jgi:hypothetical protein
VGGPRDERGRGASERWGPLHLINRARLDRPGRRHTTRAVRLDRRLLNARGEYRPPPSNPPLSYAEPHILVPPSHVRIFPAVSRPPFGTPPYFFGFPGDPTWGGGRHQPPPLSAPPGTHSLSPWTFGGGIQGGRGRGGGSVPSVRARGHRGWRQARPLLASACTARWSEPPKMAGAITV